MLRSSSAGAAALCAFATCAFAQVADFKPVTSEALTRPDPAEWLMINRTYDEQRYSPLKEIDRGNVAQLRMEWVRGLPQGTNEATPLVWRGVMYLAAPGGSVMAVAATTGDTLWTYNRNYPREMTDFIGGPNASRTKNIAIFEDTIYYMSHDGFLVALDAATGKLKWETKTHDYKDQTQSTGGIIVAEGKVITNRTCETRVGCFISAHDAKSGKEVWKFYTTPAKGEPNGETWGEVPDEKRIASSWGLPGSYDPVRKVIYWAIANPKPYTRLMRHGSAEGTGRAAPSDLYSNSTVALDIGTGKLVWYYQHLPGDDWDADHIHERTLVRTKFEPDPKAVKWINPKIPRGQERDMVFSVGEAGGIWALDRQSGEFLWATPFPSDSPDSHISRIDVDTGKVHINWDKVFKKDGDRSLVCFHNTRSWWATSYHPGLNSLYIPFHDQCLDMTANMKNPQGWGPRRSVSRPGADMAKFSGIAKVNLSSGRIDVIHSQAEPGNGSALATGGNLLFWGDMNRRVRAFDAASGKVLWQTIVGGIVQTSTITYAVDGRQYVAFLTGDGQSGTAGPIGLTKTPTVRGHNAIYVFALPPRRK